METGTWLIIAADSIEDLCRFNALAFDADMKPNPDLWGKSVVTSLEVLYADEGGIELRAGCNKGFMRVAFDILASEFPKLDCRYLMQDASSTYAYAGEIAGGKHEFWEIEPSDRTYEIVFGRSPDDILGETWEDAA